MNDQIERLIRSTGRREPVSREVAARVEGAVRARWRADVERRTSRRRWSVAAVIAAGIALALVGARLLLPAATVGDVEVVAGAAPGDLRPGDAVVADTVLTTPGDGLLAVRLSSGHSVRLDRSTRMTLHSDTRLELHGGAVYIDSGSAGPATGGLEVLTPFGPVTEIGTQFEVRLTVDSIRVAVREGEVLFRRDDGSRRVAAGRQLEADASGHVGERPLSSTAAEWRWIDEVTPMLDLDGRTLGEFLDWAARETGREVVFSDPELETSALGIRLAGSIAGMTVDQALESVLPTCGMRHRVAGDVLEVEGVDSR